MHTHTYTSARALPAGADVYSYAPDEDDMVLDPKLREHLAHWGINMMAMEKTEKTMAELQVGGSSHQMCGAGCWGGGRWWACGAGAVQTLAGSW